MIHSALWRLLACAPVATESIPGLGWCGGAVVGVWVLPSLEGGSSPAENHSLWLSSSQPVHLHPERVSVSSAGRPCCELGRTRTKIPKNFALLKADLL